MPVRRLSSLLAIAASSCLVAAGCMQEEVDDDAYASSVHPGVAADELVTERQLVGNELPHKTLSLTFDDGPGPRSAELADYLAAEGIQATFFINGSKVAGRQATLDTIVGRGHLLANHTHHHWQLTKLDPDVIVREIADTDLILQQLQPEGPWVVRAPFGAWNAKVARAVNGSDMRKYVGSVFWDQGGQLTETSGADWDCWGKRVTVERCGELYLREIRAKKRGIVLLHDIHDQTVDMVKFIVPKLLEEGYRFAELTDVPSVKRALAASDEPEGVDQCSSATLGRPVDANVCVEARGDGKWYRCIEGEWYASSSTDPQCTDRYAL